MLRRKGEICWRDVGVTQLITIADKRMAAHKKPQPVSFISNARFDLRCRSICCTDVERGVVLGAHFIHKTIFETVWICTKVLTKMMQCKQGGRLPFKDKRYMSA